MTQTIALFDMGTNSTKILVYKILDDNSSELVFKKKLENRLGRVMIDNLIQETEIENTIKLLKEVIFEIQQFNVDKMSAFGTELFRIADNSKEVLDRFKSELNLDVKILSHQDELRIFWKGLVYDFKYEGMIAAIDIGGGSVQFMYGDKTGLKGEHMFKTGVLFLRERFIKQDPATEEEYKLIEEYVREQIKEIDVVFPKGTPFIHGSSAVIDFYKAAKIKMQPYDFSKSHPYKVDLSVCEEVLYKSMRCAPKEERIKYFPLHPEFTDGSSLGFVSVLEIAKKTGLKFELPSNNNILQGLLLEALSD